jgi:putative Mg2+ transporter-C (MgtC) family protein
MRHINGHDKLTLQGISTDDEEGGRTIVIATVYSPERNDRAMEDIVARVSIEPEVRAVRWQKMEA